MLDGFRQRIREKGLLCALNLHRNWFTDGALFSSVERCGHCQHPKSLFAYALLVSERRHWELVPKDLDFEKQKYWVVKRFMKPVLDHHAAMR